jgi:hypothetical protein
MDDGLDARDGQCCVQIFQACVFSLTLFGLGKNNVALALQAGGISPGDFRNSNIIIGSRNMLECLSRQD